MTEAKFNSITQYSNDFGELTNGENTRGKNFCPFFSLITALNFLKEKDMVKSTDKNSHEKNIAKSIVNHVIHGKYYQMYFTDLISMTDLNSKDILATCVDLIANNIIGYDDIFEISEISKKYAVIFLKNGKFFVVLVDNGKYFLRDCHESVQYSYFSRSEIIKYLNEVYQFDHEIDLDGYKIEEYSTIEYIKIKAPFKINIDFDINHPLIDKYSVTKKDLSAELIIEEDYEVNEINEIYENDKLFAEQLELIELQKLENNNNNNNKDFFYI